MSLFLPNTQQYKKAMADKSSTEINEDDSKSRGRKKVESSEYWKEKLKNTFCFCFWSPSGTDEQKDNWGYINNGGVTQRG